MKSFEVQISALMFASVLVSCGAPVSNEKRTGVRSYSSNDRNLFSISSDKSIPQKIAKDAGLEPVTLSVTGRSDAVFSIVEQNCEGFYTLAGNVVSTAPSVFSLDKFGCFVKLRAKVGKYSSDILEVSAVQKSFSASLSSGFYHSCALSSDGAVNCWGDVPAGKPDGLVASAVAAGKYHTCAIEKSTQAVKCWGAGSSLASIEQYPNFGQALPPEGLKATAIVAGGYHTCAISDVGSVVCWGAGKYRSRPAQIPHFDQSSVSSFFARSLSAGEYHTCAVTNTSEVKCWGAGVENEYAAENVGQSRPPLGLINVSSVAAGGRHTCASLFSGGVVCWGDGSLGQAPASVLTGATVQSLSAGLLHTCAALSDNTINCFGAGVTSGSYPNFGQVAGTHTGRAIAAGAFHTCSVDVAADTVSCWGAGVAATSDGIYNRKQSIPPAITLPSL